jgi:hypothetical protein
VSILSPDVAWLNRAIPAPKHELFGFLTTEANSAVARVHPKAMPVILRTPGKFDLWLERDRSMRSRCSCRCLTMLCGSWPEGEGGRPLTELVR